MWEEKSKSYCNTSTKVPDVERIVQNMGKVDENIRKNLIRLPRCAYTSFLIKFAYVSLAVVFIFNLCSCSKSAQEKYRRLNIGSPTSVEVSDVLCIDEAIPLKKDGTPFHVGLEDIYRVGDRFIAHDRNRIIYLFDNDGNLMASSESIIGHGHGEYDNMLTCSLNPYSNTVEVITPIKMKIYDLEFNFVEERDIPSKMAIQGNDGCMFSEIYDLGEHVHALLPSSTSYNNGSMIIYDSLRGEILKTIDYGDDLVGLLNMQKHSFTDLGDSIMFYPSGIGKYVYSLDTQKFSLSKEIAIEGLDYDYKNLDNKNHHMDYALDSKDLMPLRCHIVGNRVCFLAKEGGTIDDMSFLLSNGYEKMDRFFIKENGYKVFPGITCSDGTSIYGLCEEGDLNDYYSSLRQDVPDSLMEYSNVILRYSLK